MARALSLVAVAGAVLAASGEPNATIYVPSVPGFSIPAVTGASVVGAESGRATLALCVSEAGGRCPVTVTQEESTQRFHFGIKIGDVSIPDIDCTLQPKQESAACQGGVKAGGQEATIQQTVPVSQVDVPITAGAEKLAANPTGTASRNGSAGATGSREPTSSAPGVTSREAVLAAVAAVAAVGCAMML